MVKCKFRITENSPNYDTGMISVCTCKNKIMAYCVTRLGREKMRIDNPLVCFDCDDSEE